MNLTSGRAFLPAAAITSSAASVPALWLLDSVPAMFLVTALVTTFPVMVAFVLRPGLLLIYAFQLGLLLFVLPDGVIVGGDVLGVAGEDLGLLAARYVCISMLMFQCGYWVFAADAPAPSTAERWRLSRLALPGAIVLEIIYLAATAEFTYVSATAGRYTAVESGVLSAMGRAIAVASAIALTGFITYCISRMRWPQGMRILVAFLVTSPILVQLYVQGNRFPLMYCASTFLITLFPSYLKPTVAHLGGLMLALSLAMGVSTKMVEARDEFYGVETSDRLLYGLIKSEAILESNVLLMKYFDGQAHTNGATLANIFLFWVPRDIWKDKPTFLGFWLPRATASAELGEQHSVAFGFGGEAYADFGFGGGATFCLILGLLIGRGERVVARMRKQGGFSVTMAALAIPFAFFLARNLDTAVFLTSSVALLLWVLHRTFTRSASPQ